MSYEQLVDLVEDRLSPQEASALRDRIVGDPRAQQQLAEIERLLGWRELLF